MEKTIRSGTRESCVAQLSIYVILRGNEETKRYINQVRRSSSSDRIYECILIKARNSKLVFGLTFLEAPSKRDKRRIFYTLGIIIFKCFSVNSHDSELSDMTAPDNRNFVLTGNRQRILICLIQK